MSTGTVMPNPVFTGFDDDGEPLSGGLLYTYAAGTTTALATYSEVSLTTANANPVVLDSAGRAVVFLTPASYKFILKDSTGTTIWTQDNISAIPASTVDVDVTGTAGEALSATDCCYLSDGSGSLTAGRWYKTDADVGYASSSAGTIGMATAAIASGASGAIRLIGRLTGFVGLTIGADYYASGTAGAITATAPATPRFVGKADSLTSLVLTPNPPRPIVNPGLCQGRLTLTTGTPVTTGDVSAATSVYFTPYQGNLIALYDGTAWLHRGFSELTLSLSGKTASTPYDVFAYDNSGVVAVELLAWTNATTRATAITTQDGVLVKTGATTRRLLGTVYINSTGGQTDDTAVKRYVSNLVNYRSRPLRVIDTTASWTYTTAAYRQANGSTSNQVEVMVCWADRALELTVSASSSNSSANIERGVAIGEDSTSSGLASQLHVGSFSGVTLANHEALVMASIKHFPAVGRHVYAWLEKSTAAGTTTWYGVSAAGSVNTQAGMVGSFEG